MIMPRRKDETWEEEESRFQTNTEPCQRATARYYERQQQLCQPSERKDCDGRVLPSSLWSETAAVATTAAAAAAPASASSVASSSSSSSRSDASSSSAMAVIPGVNAADVICGRDKRTHVHQGNRRFRALVQQYRHQYQSTRRREDKTAATQAVADAVQRSWGGRFLRYEPTASGGRWVELRPAEAYEKVSHALRSAKDLTASRRRREEREEKKLRVATRQDAFQRILRSQRDIFADLVRKDEEIEQQQLQQEQSYGDGDEDIELRLVRDEIVGDIAIDDIMDVDDDIEGTTTVTFSADEFPW